MELTSKCFNSKKSYSYINFSTKEDILLNYTSIQIEGNNTLHESKITELDSTYIKTA